MKRKLTVLLCAVMAMCLAFGSMTGCTKKKISNEKTAFVVMSEEMDGVFNPFFYTSGPDGEVVSMTQLGMLSADDNGNIVAGNDEPTVVLDYASSYRAGVGPLEDGVPVGETTYTFVLKNGLKFSDGVPLSIRDVLFNLYVYLDPVYTGSSTIYSTDIKGLSKYRTQSTNSDADSALEQSAATEATKRRTNLINAVNGILTKASQDLSINVTEAYVLEQLEKEYGTTNPQYITDFKTVQKLFAEELEEDYRNAEGAYKEAPYNFTDVEGFMYSEQRITWDKKTNSVKEYLYDRDAIKTKEAAIEYVYTTNMPKEFANIATYWGSAVKLMEQFTAEAKEKLLQGDGGSDLMYPNIEGIVALDGAKADQTKVTVNGTDYAVATLPSGHNEDGTYSNWGDFNSDWSVKDSSKYQVLQITINGIDPKAIWNFAFSVAPLHYYSDDAHTKAFSIEDNRFGVQYASMNFMDNTINHVSKVGVPVGAGPYKATDRNNAAKPSSDGFFNNNIVYFTRNDDFLLGAPKIKLIRYQVINQAQSINAVKSGTVHYATPQATTANMAEIERSAKTVTALSNTQNGYGYIGINAGKIPNVNLRKAIMSACDISLTTDYYGEYAELLYWPMSKESWAYPRTGNTYYDVPAYPYGKDGDKSDAAVQSVVRDYMAKAGIQTQPTGGTTTNGLTQYEITTKIGSQTVDLNYTFTIAGANLTEHPTYSTFRKAQEILNSCGWNVKVDPDNYALSKLASGSLTVWAAAWSSTIDPDMYQVYHRNSTATSTYSWGYREMKNGASSGKVSVPISTLVTDYATVQQLSTIIEDARKVDAKELRTPLYRDALQKVMDLAVELPTYQRKNIYLYNNKFVDGDSLNHSKSSYTNPLSRIWEVSLNEN